MYIIGKHVINIGQYKQGYYPFFCWNQFIKCIPIGFANIYILKYNPNKDQINE